MGHGGKSGKGVPSPSVSLKQQQKQLDKYAADMEEMKEILLSLARSKGKGGGRPG